MENTSRLVKARKRDAAYYRQRQKNRVFTELAKFFAEEAESRGITKKDLAEALNKDPSQITRWLAAPSNFELDTLSDILLALGAEMDHRIVRFSDRPKPNYIHGVFQEIGSKQPAPTVASQQKARVSSLGPTGAEIRATALVTAQ